MISSRTVSYTHLDVYKRQGFYWQNKLLLKRIIGQPGDVIDMDVNGVVSVNGVALDEPYVDCLLYTSYAEDLSCFSVAWHWHEEFEFILAALGPIHVDVNKTRLTLQTGQGVFINSGALHAVEPAEGRALLHSGVFQPRLVGGMDTVFWQKLIRPLLQPGTPPFFLLDEAVPWQRQVLLCLREAWKGVADEPFDYENRVRYHLTACLLYTSRCV